MPALRLLLPIGATLASTPLASAQEGGDIELQAFQPGVDSKGLVTLEGASVLEPGELSMGLITTWGRGLLRLESDEARYEVVNMVSPTLTAAVGLPTRAQLGVALPFHIMQGARVNGPDDSRSDFSGQGLGSASLHLKLSPFPASLLRVAVIGSVLFPTSSERESWLGAPAVRPQAKVAVERRLGSLRLTGNVGFRYQPGETLRFRDEPTGTAGTMAEISSGSSIPFGGGLAVAVVPERFDVIAEVFGAAPLDGDHFPLEGLLGARFYLAASSYLTIGGGTGLLRGRGDSPDLRAFIGIVFEPRSGDRAAGQLPDHDCPDGPGCVVAEVDAPEVDDLVDDDDECPEDPSPDDDYRCPDLDTDEDGIPDIDDLCPFEPGPRENAGCPERRRVIDTGGQLKLLEKIHFEFDSAVIKRESHAILDLLAETLRANPKILRVEVQGHTDERGPDVYNLRLSQQRAEAVVAYLVGARVARSRLVGRGYGEREPIDSGHDERAWYRNRRVEFVILERSD